MGFLAAAAGTSLSSVAPFTLLITPPLAPAPAPAPGLLLRCTAKLPDPPNSTHSGRLQIEFIRFDDTICQIGSQPCRMTSPGVDHLVILVRYAISVVFDHASHLVLKARHIHSFLCLMSLKIFMIVGHV
jgi:hypothetical protein